MTTYPAAIKLILRDFRFRPRRFVFYLFPLFLYLQWVFTDSSSPEDSQLGLAWHVYWLSALLGFWPFLLKIDTHYVRTIHLLPVTSKAADTSYWIQSVLAPPIVLAFLCSISPTSLLPTHADPVVIFISLLAMQAAAYTVIRSFREIDFRIALRHGALTQESLAFLFACAVAAFFGAGIAYLPTRIEDFTPLCFALWLAYAAVGASGYARRGKHDSPRGEFRDLFRPRPRARLRPKRFPAKWRAHAAPFGRATVVAAGVTGIFAVFAWLLNLGNPEFRNGQWVVLTFIVIVMAFISPSLLEARRLYIWRSLPISTAKLFAWLASFPCMFWIAWVVYLIVSRGEDSMESVGMMLAVSLLMIGFWFLFTGLAAQFESVNALSGLFLLAVIGAFLVASPLTLWDPNHEVRISPVTQIIVATIGVILIVVGTGLLHFALTHTSAPYKAKRAGEN